MEREKRKKVPLDNGGGVVEETKKKRKKTREAAETTAKEVVEPTTEEVEEFCEILRRMNAAMRYLKGAKKRLTERTAAVRMAEVGKRGELDLNEVPADSAN